MLKLKLAIVLLDRKEKIKQIRKILILIYLISQKQYNRLAYAQ